MKNVVVNAIYAAMDVDRVGILYGFDVPTRKLI